MRIFYQRRQHPALPGGMAAALLCLLGPVLLSTSAAAQQREVVLASGPKGGMYHRLAEGIQRRLEGQGLAVRIVPMPDCAESLDWIGSEAADGEVRFAFIQQDLVGEHFRHAAGSSLRVVDRVSFDYLHIFVREFLSVDSAADLAGRRIWAGEQGSALRFTATRFLDSLGASPERFLTYEDLEKVSWGTGDLRVEGYAVQELPKWLGDGRLDAAMLIAPAGAPEVSEVILHGRCSLLSLDPRTLRGLRSKVRESNPFLRHIAFGSIPQGTYVYQGRALSTLVVPILLLAHEGTSPELATKIRDAARQEWDAIGADSRRRPGWQVPAASLKAEPLAHSGLKLLNGVEREDPDPERFRRVEYLLLGLLAAGAVFVATLMRRRWTRGARNLWRHYPRLCKIVLPLAAAMLLITGLTYYAERDINESFSSFWESWWSITIYIFSGLEDRVPYTLRGRILVMFGLALGAICSAVFTGWTAAVFIRREKNMPAKLKDHCLLLNWNERGIDIVRELHHPVLRKHGRTATIVVLADDEDLTLQSFRQTGNRLEEAFEEVYLRIGDPGDETALRQANAQHARTVLILANERHGDQRTIRAILQLRKIAHQCDRTDLHVVAELLDAANDSIVDELAKEFPGLLESVSGLKLRTYLLSQAALNQGVVGFYKDLLSVEEATNEVYAERIPPEAAGMSFHEYAAFVLGESAGQSPIIPVGVQRVVAGKIQVFTNPRAGREEAILRRDDKLILIAYGPPGAPLPKPDGGAALAPATTEAPKAVVKGGVM